MTEQEIINYFQTHGLEIQEYNIDADGNIVLRANENWERNWPQELKDSLADYKWVIKLSYRGIVSSDGFRYYEYYWQQDNNISYSGAVPCHYYCDNQGQALPKNRLINNPSNAPSIRILPLSIATTLIATTPISINKLMNDIKFRSYDIVHTFAEWREYVSNHEMQMHQISISNFQFYIGVVISLVHIIPHFEASNNHYWTTDSPIWYDILPMYFWEATDKTNKKWLFLGQNIKKR